MNISKRIASLSISPTISLNTKAQELKAKGIDVINLSVGEPDFQTPTIIVDEAIAALKAGKTKYGPSGGGLKLRQKIVAKLANENQVHFDPAQVVVGMGAKEILFHVFLALLNEGDEVLLWEPSWVSYKEQIKAAGGVPIMIPFHGEGKSIVDCAVLEKYASSRTVAIVVCSPNNPAGYTLKEEELRLLGNYLETKNWWIVSDDIYEYLSFDVPFLSLLQISPKLQDKYILVNALSKSFAMTGWRVGYMAGPRQVADLVRNLQSHSSTCLPPFIEEAAALALDKGKELVAEKIDLLKQRRDFSLNFLKTVEGISWIKPEGAFYVFVDVREALRCSKEFNAEDTLKFSEYLLTTYHLAVVPGDAFETPGFVRFSYATDEKTLKEGLERFKKAIHSLSA